MILGAFRRLYKNDFKPEDQDLVEKISYPLNTGIESIYEAFNKKISLSDNLLCTIRDVEVTVDSTGKPVNTTSFKLDFTGSVSSIFVGNAQNLTNTSTYPTSAPFISWTQTQTGVTINNVTGLQPNNNYRLRIIAFGT